MWEDHMCTKSKQKLWEEPRLTKTNVGGTHVNNRKQNYGWNPVNAQINWYTLNCIIQKLTKTGGTRQCIG